MREQVVWRHREGRLHHVRDRLLVGLRHKVLHKVLLQHEVAPRPSRSIAQRSSRRRCPAGRPARELGVASRIARRSLIVSSRCRADELVLDLATLDARSLDGALVAHHRTTRRRPAARRRREARRPGARRAATRAGTNLAHRHLARAARPRDLLVEVGELAPPPEDVGLELAALRLQLAAAHLQLLLLHRQVGQLSLRSVGGRTRADETRGGGGGVVRCVRGSAVRARVGGACAGRRRATCAASLPSSASVFMPPPISLDVAVGRTIAGLRCGGADSVDDQRR